MKKYLYILTLLITGFEGCKDDPKPLTELEKLPPATQSGKQTFGCLVNGKAWVPQTSIDAVAVFQQGILQISGSLNNPFQSIGLIIHEDVTPISTNDEYLLTNYPGSFSRVTIELTEVTACIYEPQNTYSGIITITKLDRINYIVSGLFEFETVTIDCDTLRITDGRFDIRYIP